MASKNLNEFSVFQGFTDDEMQIITDNSIEKSFPRDTIVVEESDKSKDLYIILEGRVSVEMEVISSISPEHTERLSIIKEGEVFKVGNIELKPLFTPGHTDHHHAYLLDTPIQKLLFTGDALLIEACGRTDFQSGSAEVLYNSIHNKIFSFPDETLVYPGHDYEGRFITTVAQEKVRNPRLGGGRSKQEFIKIMDGLDLPYPRKIDFAVPGNEQCGVCPDNVPDEFKGSCAIHDQG